MRKGISIHALLAESDYSIIANLGRTATFLSTLSLRRATIDNAVNFHTKTGNFYPRSPCGERPFHPPVEPVKISISIHALLAESDSSKIMFSSFIAYFYPRSPCGERQRANSFPHAPPQISIHALLAESDSKPRALKSLRCVFLSTLSLRRATHRVDRVRACESFLSTLSLRRATCKISTRGCEKVFLSTLSLRRATLQKSCFHHS